MRKTVSGFTIVELLIVIVVIAVLALIAAATFNGVQNRGHDAALQSDLNVNSKLLANYQSVNGSYPSTVPTLTTVTAKFSKGSYSTVSNNVYYCRDNTSDAYSITAMSKSGAMYTVGSANMTVRPYVGNWGSTPVCTGTGVPDFTVIGGYVNSTWQGWTN